MEIYIHKMFIELHVYRTPSRVYGSPKIAEMGIHIHGELVTIAYINLQKFEHWEIYIHEI